MPNIPGIDTFTGPAFHSAEWDHAIDLTGKRVAVVIFREGSLYDVTLELAERDAYEGP